MDFGQEGGMGVFKYIGWLFHTIAVFVIARAVSHSLTVESLVVQIALGVVLSAIGYYASYLGLRHEFKVLLRQGRLIDQGHHGSAEPGAAADGGAR